MLSKSTGCVCVGGGGDVQGNFQLKIVLSVAIFFFFVKPFIQNQHNKALCLRNTWKENRSVCAYISLQHPDHYVLGVDIFMDLAIIYQYSWYHTKSKLIPLTKKRFVMYFVKQCVRKSTTRNEPTSYDKSYVKNN